MTKLLIDARAITNCMDGLGYYSVYFIRRIIDYFKSQFDFCIVLPASLEDVTVIGPDIARQAELIFTPHEKFTGDSYNDDFKEWDDFVSSLKPDVYISTAFFATNYNCARIVIVHDVIPLVYSGRFRADKVQFYSKALTSTINNSELIIANSHYTKRDILATFPKCTTPIKVLYPDIESIISRVRHNTFSSRPEDDYFLVVGLKCVRKNIELVLKALALLQKRENWCCRAFFVGKLRESEVPLPELIRHYQVEDVTTILGYVSDERMRELIIGSRGLLFPSQYEGFGIPLIEFLAAEKPIICTRNTSIPEVVGDLAYYCKNEPYEFADSILKVYYQGPYHHDPQAAKNHLRKLTTINKKQFDDVFEWILDNCTMDYRTFSLAMKSDPCVAV